MPLNVEPGSPHKIIILFKADVRGMLPDGAVSGKVNESTGNIILDIECKHLDEAVAKLKSLEDEVRKLCQLKQL